MWLGFGPCGWDLGLKAGIWASRLGFGPHGWELGLKAGIWAWRLGFGPRGWNLGLEAGIWASRVESGPRGWDLGLEAGVMGLEPEIKVKSLGGGVYVRSYVRNGSPLCSIGHRPFGAAAQKELARP